MKNIKIKLSKNQLLFFPPHKATNWPMPGLEHYNVLT